MITRRKFIKTSALATGTFLINCNASTIRDTHQDNIWHMPDEGDTHERTWMSFVANDYIWEDVQIPVVLEDLARIARTIAKYEPVSVLISTLDKALAQELIGSNHNYPITFVEFETDDLWLRDTGPTFVIKNNEKACINFNFNGWGNDQEHTLDQHVANFIAQQSGSKVINTDLVLEGGCFEVDGTGNAIMTESCILNDNRNPNKSKEEVTTKLKSLLGLKNITWLKGIKGQDITDGHTDFYARFTKEAKVLVSLDNFQGSHDYDVTRENQALLSVAKDKNGTPYTLTLIETPDTIHAVGNKVNKEDDFAAGYIGYYLCNGAVIMQGFGDTVADKKAYDVLRNLFPNRAIEQIRIDGIASGGGSIHCATQQEPRV